MEYRKSDVEVHQLRIRGGRNDGKWFVLRGSGINTKYLRRSDLTWHRVTGETGFFWDNEEEANEAIQELVKKDLEPVPPP